MHEIELKFLVDNSLADDLISRLDAFGSRKSGECLRSVYFDTSDHALHAHGASLRLRLLDGKCVQTLKMRGKTPWGLSDAVESEVVIEGEAPRPSAIPDKAVRRQVQKLIDGRPIAAICETIIARHACEVTTDGGTRAELAIDKGEIRAGDRTTPIQEVEIELIEGRAADLFDLSKKVFCNGGFRFSTQAKADRGYMLASSKSENGESAAWRARDLPLNRDDSVHDSAIIIFSECLEQISHNLAHCHRSNAPEYCHQLRIGLRRLRTAAAILSPAIGCAELDRLAKEARWLARQAGEIRDLDVIRDAIVKPAMAKDAGPVSLDATLECIRGLAEAARAEKQPIFRGKRASDFLLDLARFVQTQGWLEASASVKSSRLTRPICDLAGKALDKNWKRVCKKARKLADLDIAQRHELRKRLKQLRYCAEFFRPLYPEKKVKPFISRLKRLQDLFGELNDLAVLVHHAEKIAGEDETDRKVELGLGYLIGINEARARQDWQNVQSRWKDLNELGLFWQSHGAEKKH